MCQIISSVFIKAGSEQTGDGCFLYETDTNDGCYTIGGINSQTVTVAKIGDGDDCKDISHVEFVLDPGSSPSPSLSPSPSPSSSTDPSPSPSPSSSTDPSPSPSPSDDNDNGDSDNGDESDDNSNDSSSDNSNSNVGGPSNTSITEEKQGEVLGASTMAGTGSLGLNVLNLGQLLGLTLSGIGASLYAKKKNK